MKKFQTITIRLEGELLKSLNKRLKELDTDKSKYIRQLILAEILMKSQPNNSLKSLLNP